MTTAQKSMKAFLMQEPGPSCSIDSSKTSEMKKVKAVDSYADGDILESFDDLEDPDLQM